MMFSAGSWAGAKLAWKNLLVTPFHHEYPS